MAWRFHFPPRKYDFKAMPHDIIYAMTEFNDRNDIVDFVNMACGGSALECCGLHILD